MATRILSAVDDRESSQIAIAVAARLANALGVQLTLLAVNQMLTGVSMAGGIWEYGEVKKLLDDAALAAAKAGMPTAKTVEISGRDVATAIVTYAESNHFDHIVVGSANNHGVARLLLGSVSRDVVSRAHCTVTVARAHSP